MSKRNIIIAVIALVVAVGIAVGFFTDGFGLKGLYFSAKKITPGPMAKVKPQLPTCTQLLKPKVLNSQVYPTMSGGGYYQLGWQVKDLCTSAKLDIYMYSGETLVYTAEAGIKANVIPGTNVKYYLMNGKYAGNLSQTAVCVAGKPCMAKSNIATSLGYYTPEAAIASVASGDIVSKGKRYYLLKISDSKGKELARSDIIAVKASVIPKVTGLYPVAATIGTNKNAYKLKWSVSDFSPAYTLEILYYFTSDYLVYTAEPKKKIQFVQGTPSVAFYTLEPWFTTALYKPTPSNAIMTTGKTPYGEIGPYEPSGNKNYYALFVKKDGYYLPYDYSSPLLNVFNAMQPALPPTPPAKK